MAWETLHGVHEVPKKYVPPFVKDQAQDNLDCIYEIEAEGYELKEEAKEPKLRNEEPVM